MKPFAAPDDHLQDLDVPVVAALVAAVSDVALVVSEDGGGVIRDIAIGSDELAQDVDRRWVGKRWTDVVVPDSRDKVEQLLREAAAGGAPRWRHVNHPSGAGGDLPLTYAVMRLARRGHYLAVGRSLRPMAALQQQLVEAQQAMDREYLRLRQVETRHRLLFQVSSEAVVIVDAATQRVVEANPAALRLLADGGRRAVGRAVLDVFDAASRPAVESLLAAVLATGRAQDAPARLQGEPREYYLFASLFREGRALFHLLRLTRADKIVQVTPSRSPRVLDVVDASPDAFVVTSTDGRILYTNRAFLDCAQLATPEQAREQSLDRWLGRPGIDFTLMASQLREHGALRLFATTVQGDLGLRTEVEICGVALPEGEQPCYGFTIREVSARSAAEKAVPRGKPRSVEQLTSMVGRVPLKELVRESTDMIERLCIEEALSKTGDNRASAAEVLGLSRQSLYAKLRRHGLGDLSTSEEAEAVEDE